MSTKENNSRTQKMSEEVGSQSEKVEAADPWKIEPIHPEQVQGPFLEESNFSILFPQYREKYIQECHGIVKKRLMEHGIKLELNLLEGSMTVRTTKKTWDPFIIIKAKDVIRLISRSVPYQQALKVLEDGITCDIIKIRSSVRNKERFIKRRQRLIGPNGDTLKALELLTECYILVQGSTVSVIGSYRNLKVAKKVITETMQNIHPIYNIKELMVKRELMKDENMKGQNWDKFLPKFIQVKQKRKTRKQQTKKHKEYETFPPEPTPRQQDIKMETGEYFLSEKQVKQRKIDIKKKKQERLKKQQEMERMEREQNAEAQQLQQEIRREQHKTQEESKKKGQLIPSTEQLKNKFLRGPIKKIEF